jgi:hypothetical protein
MGPLKVARKHYRSRVEQGGAVSSHHSPPAWGTGASTEDGDQRLHVVIENYDPPFLSLLGWPHPRNPTWRGAPTHPLGTLSLVAGTKVFAILFVSDCCPRFIGHLSVA